MNSILILCVNYNSYNELINYLDSINHASYLFGDEIKIDLMIADNTNTNFKEIDISIYKALNISFKPYHINLGYMGAIMKLIEDKGNDKVMNYDYVIVSNVDLLFSETFFVDLFNYNIAENIGWIAPKIFSKSESRDRNPKMLDRPSLKRLDRLLIMYKYPILYKIYNGLIYRFRNKKLISQTNNKIYAGHGSLMIFTKSFIRDHVSFKFPSFLFGEEIFFGELARLSKLDVIYIPDIVVQDIDHVSTGSLKRSIYCKMNYESLSILKESFWNE